MACGFSPHGNANVTRHTGSFHTTENWQRNWLGNSHVDHFISRHWFSWRHNLRHRVCLLLNGTRVEVFIFSRLWWCGGVCLGTAQGCLTDPINARDTTVRGRLLYTAYRKWTRNRDVGLTFRPHVNIWNYQRIAVHYMRGVGLHQTF